MQPYYNGGFPFILVKENEQLAKKYQKNVESNNTQTIKSFVYNKNIVPIQNILRSNKQSLSRQLKKKVKKSKKK